MGRTVPAFVQLIQESIRRWEKFRRALRREDQPHFERLFTRVRCYTQTATYQAHDNPMEATPERRGCFVRLLQGQVLDLCPNQRGMTLWPIDRNQSHYRLTDIFAPAFYVSGSEERRLFTFIRQRAGLRAKRA